MKRPRFPHLICILGALCICALTSARHIKTISSQEGISNNAILCIHQNSIGHLYIGTADGLNIWNGHSMETFVAADGHNYFFGNMIKHILPFTEDVIFLQTNYGVAKLNMITREVDFFEEFAFNLRIAPTKTGDILTIDKNNILNYFDIETETMSSIANFPFEEGEICHKMIVSEDGRLCVFTDKDIYHIEFGFDDNGQISIRGINNLDIACRFISPNFNGKEHILISQDNRIYSFGTKDCAPRLLAEFDRADGKMGGISGIIQEDEGFYISFMQDGLMFLPAEGDGRLVPTEIECGIFSMFPDISQPIIWIGTDCNGLLRWCDNLTDARCITYEQMPYSINMPVRSIYVDKDRSLWFGTKGDGLYRIRNFSPEASIDKTNMDRFTTADSELLDNRIFALSESSHGIFWIGSEGSGLNIWSEKRQRIEKVRGSEGIQMVHSIIEQNDSTLWVATDQRGSFRCSLKWEGEIPVIQKAEQLDFCEPFSSRTAIFSIAIQNDSTIWFSSRGQGVLSYNANTGLSKVLQFPDHKGFALNETFYITKSRDILFATGNGLVAYDPRNDSIKFSEHVPPKALHGIISDSKDNIWLSSNYGIISLDSAYNYRTSFDRFSGMEVLEYSDGACYRDTTDNVMYFGGINGLTVIREDYAQERRSYYNPPSINLTDFIQNDEHTHISLKMKNGKLRIPYSKSLFAIGFSVVDNINYPDYQFSYSIKGYNPEWMVNPDDIIYLPSLDPGNYILRIRYLNKATGYMSEECTLPIYIIPPMHLRWWALLIYLIVISFGIYRSIIYTKKKYETMQRKIEKQYTDEIIRIKNETSATIIEELSVLITFILGLCQQIRQQTQNNSNVAGKVNLVEYNIAKINKILRILNEYKSIPESVANYGEITLIPVSQISSEILDLMGTSIRIKQVVMTCDIESDIILAINKEAYLAMFNALIQKVIGITSGKKEMHLEIRRSEAEGICISIRFSADDATFREVSSTIDHNRLYSMENSDDTIKEFELILCTRLVNEMKGSIDPTFDPGNSEITIRIELPQHTINEGRLKYEDSHISENINAFNTVVENQLFEQMPSDIHPETIYLISSKKDISSFLGYFLAGKYNIRIFSSNDEALENILTKVPTVIIYDISSMFNNFAIFLDKKNESKRMRQIPVIALTSSLQFTEREECIKMGADLCISFPFNIDYLHSALEKIINKREKIAEYYKSPEHAYIIDEGKIIHKEDKDFINRIIKIIEDNISNPDLSTAVIAKEMNISTRVLYRRLEGITVKKLHDIIKELRMKHATNLLSSSKLTIDEIMYRVGHDNRSTFYRNFKSEYGLTPKEYRNNIKENVLKSLSGSGEEGGSERTEANQKRQGSARS